MQLKGSKKIGNKFQNPVPTAMAGFSGMLEILGAYISNKAESTPKKTLGPFFTDPEIYNTPPASGLRVTLIGHSSLLIEIDGKRLLTDPVWSSRASFSQQFGPKRFFAAPLPLKHLPHIDGVLISHDHYDHFDEAAIRTLAAKNIPFYCSLGVGQYLKKWGAASHQINEMDWGDSATIGSDLKITTTPTRHFSGRSLTNRFETLWSAFVIKGTKHNIFFGADSGWFDGFYDIGNAYGPFDLTMLEIGASHKLWEDIHMGPYKAADAHLALKGNVMMPIHWGTFNLALHAWYEPIEELLPYAVEKNIDLFIPEPGKPTEMTGHAYNSEWWKRWR